MSGRRSRDPNWWWFQPPPQQPYQGAGWSQRPIADPVAFYNAKTRAGWSDNRIRAAMTADQWEDVQFQLQQEVAAAEGAEGEHLVQRAFRVFQALMGTSPAVAQKAQALFDGSGLNTRSRRDRVHFVRMLLQNYPELSRWIYSDQSMTRMKQAISASFAQMEDLSLRRAVPARRPNIQAWMENDLQDDVMEAGATFGTRLQDADGGLDEESRIPDRDLDDLA